jgi:hypothetical protein
MIGERGTASALPMTSTERTKQDDVTVTGGGGNFEQVVTRNLSERAGSMVIFLFLFFWF